MKRFTKQPEMQMHTFRKSRDIIVHVFDSGNKITIVYLYVVASKVVNNIFILYFSILLTILKR